MSIASIYRTKLGGSADAFALSALGAGLVLTSPAMSSVPGVVPMALGAAGGTYLGTRVLEYWRERNVLESKISLESAAALSSPDGLLVGYTTDTGKPVYIPDENLVQHGFIGGQSGVGKTVLGKLLMFQQIQRGGGMAFVDGKLTAEDIETIYHYCCWCGREQDFLVINPGDPDKSHTYNPILGGDPDEVSARVLSLIPASEQSPGSDHYRQAANEGIATIVAGLKAAGLAYNFTDFSILLQNAKAMEELETRLRRTKPEDPATKSLSLFLERFKAPLKPGSKAELDMKRLKETFGGVAGRMAMFGKDKFGQVTNTYTPDVKLYDAILQGKIVYVALPTMGKNEAASNFGKMFLGDLRTAISWVQALPEHLKPKIPFLVFMDELGSYAVMSLSRPYEQARSAGIALFGAVQTLANLESVSAEFKEMVLGNSWTKIFFKIGTQKTAVELADLMGMRTGIARSLSSTSNTSKTSPILNVAPEGGAGAGEGLSESEREQEEYRVSPDDLKRLGKGECIMQFGGDDLFNLRVPMLRLSKKVRKELGPLRINRFRHRPVEGADFFKQADKYLTPSGPSRAREPELANE